MKVKRELIIIALLTMFFSFSVLCPGASAWTTSGKLGQYLDFTVSAPTETKMGESVVVDMAFKSTYDFVDISPRNYFISIETLHVNFYGANISYYKTWQNITLRAWETIHDNATMKPTMEGSILCSIWAIYNYTYEGSSTVGSSWGSAALEITNVKMVTYNELWNRQNLLYNAIYVLVLTTTTFIATTVYFAKRKQKIA